MESSVNPFREAWGWIKVGLLTVAGRTVRTEDYEIAYNHVASTYDDWNARMAVHTLKVLPEVWLEEIRAHPEEKVRVLDFACGNGIVTRALLERLEGCPNLEIVGVDLSPGMIEVCRKTITDPRAAFVHAEGLSYLRAKKAGQFHAVFCGWGLVYFSKAPVLAEFARVLVPGGLVGAIMNVRGTLAGVEEAYLKTMVENPRQMRKVMTIRFSLPESGTISLKVLNTQGQTVKILANSKFDQGMHSCVLNSGELSTGIFFILLQTENQLLTRNMILTK